MEYQLMKDEDYITANNGRVDRVPLFSGKTGYEKEQSITFPVRSNFNVEIGYYNQYNNKMYDEWMNEYLV